MIVIDASAALSLVLPSQTTRAALALFNTHPPQPFIAPALYAIEVRNALLKAERRRIPIEKSADEAASQLDELVERQPFEDSPATLIRLTALARAHGLSLFDAAYLDLAITKRASIASRDAGLIDAAKRRRVEVVDLR